MVTQVQRRLKTTEGLNPHDTQIVEIHNSKKMIKLKIVFEEVMVYYRAPCLE